MTTFNALPMSQLSFAWPEADSVPAIATVTVPKTIPLGVAAPASSDARPSQLPPSNIILATQPKEMRRGRPEHISDLLLVVLDRYGISPDEFLAGL